MVHLDYRDARPIYAQIIENYKAQITSGILEAGDKLPSVRDLASQLAINPNTIQRAYRELELQGWIVSVPGKGSFVCQTAHHSQQQQLLDTFDEVTAQLLSLGVPREVLIERLQQGGNSHA